MKRGIEGGSNYVDGDIGEGGDVEILSFRDFDNEVTAASFLLGLREKFNTATEAISTLVKK